MAKILLTENFTIDFSDKKLFENKKDLLENLTGGKLLVEGQEVKCLGVYAVPVSRISDKPNKNGRIYDSITWQKPLEEKHAEGAIGLIDHPLPGQAPSLKDGFCVWRNLRTQPIQGTNESYVMQDMYIADNHHGRHIQSLIDSGAKIDVSTRSFGEMSEDNRVRDLQMCSTDAVTVGSAGVKFGKEDAFTPDRLPENVKTTASLKETQKTLSNIKEDTTNNHTPESTKKKISLGETIMNRILLRQMIEKALELSPNQAYFKLEEISKEISKDADFADIAKELGETITNLKAGILQEEGGDHNAAGFKVYPGTKNKITDTDEEEPQDVEDMEVDSGLKDNVSDRSGQTKIKSGSGKDSRESEVNSGEQMEGAEVQVELTEDTEVFEDEEGHFVITENDEKVYIDLDSINEETDEEEPEDVEDMEVEDLDDTNDSDRTDSISKQKAGSGADESVLNLNKMNKSELIDVVIEMDKASNLLKSENEKLQEAFDTLNDLTVKMETWALMSETTLKANKADKEAAQTEVEEAVAYAKELKEKLDATEVALTETQDYVAKLENTIHENETSIQENVQVTGYVTDLIVKNPSLAVFERELRTCKSLHEVREAVSKYAPLSKKIRLDMPFVEADLSSQKAPLSEGRQMLANRGMI